jgi:hypothetical protein
MRPASPKDTHEIGDRACGRAKHNANLGALGGDVGDRLEIERPREERIGIVTQERPTAEGEDRRRGDGPNQARSPEWSGLQPRLGSENEGAGGRRRGEPGAVGSRLRERTAKGGDKLRGRIGRLEQAE